MAGALPDEAHLLQRPTQGVFMNDHLAGVLQLRQQLRGRQRFVAGPAAQLPPVLVRQLDRGAALFLVADRFEAAGQPVQTAFIHRIQPDLLCHGNILGLFALGKQQDRLRPVAFAPVVAILYDLAQLLPVVVGQREGLKWTPPSRQKNIEFKL